MTMVEVDEARCIGCGRCADDCIADDLRIEGGVAQVLGRCLLCGHCVAVCPTGAVSIPGYDMDDVGPAAQLSEFVAPKDLLRAIKSRRSIRAYRLQPVGREELELVLQAGRYTATAKNAQACRFVAVQEGLDEFKRIVWDGLACALGRTDEDARWAQPMMPLLTRERRSPVDDYLFRNAPAVLFVAAERADDAGLAAQNMELMAASLGMGVMYNGYLCRASENIPEAKEWLGAQDRPLQICMLLGYPARTYRRTAPRRPGDFVMK